MGCGSSNYLRHDCPNPKKKDFNKSRSGAKRPEGNEELVDIISEVFMVQDGNSWWIDFGTTRHICKDKACFKIFEMVEDGVFLYTENS